MVDPHATLFLGGEIGSRLEQLRARWDPRMAAQIAAHVTVAYPAEIPAIETMTRQVSEAADRVGPFRLQLARVRCFARPEDGVYAEVLDQDGGWRALRALIGSAAEKLTVEPHATIVHPRTSASGPAAWAELAGTTLDGEAQIDHVAVTAFDGLKWITVSRFALRGPPPN